MPLVIAVWPNNTISLVRMWNGFTMLDLFTEIDHESDPLDAECWLVRHDDDGMHVTFDWKDMDDDEPVSPKSRNIGVGLIHGRKKRLKWPEDIHKQWFRKLERDCRHEGAREAARYLSAHEIPKMPSPPPPRHTVNEVRRMESFCGVYFVYDSDGKCHYVGEAEDVTRRVAKSHEAIKAIGDGVMIGVLSCAKHERKLIEAYFVGLLDPPGNGISTHRMSLK